MIPILVFTLAAAFFGIGVYSVYGADALTRYPWVDAVFWGLIATGIAIAIIDDWVACKLCALGRHFERLRLFCPGAPCSH